MKNNDKISVAQIFLDPIKKRVSVKSVYVEAVYLEALLYYKNNIQLLINLVVDHEYWSL